ncbi:unnamed protein product (macronuclear) [Paramecium tetraurelia]|uniref:Uncharacterized protein n=1 Tax=Paramecium tetraurelia TaxID=5888 RepID=A0EGV3_PARTE|nr:uncharacterized protein GSPATT00026868001 [Paramecium tetraurelia]CAK94544.1 unnamed protein product [Paramecium tetraurelia]|eukprot:XP_001461917.1 hypothetical protein (macronuclear) [Paramecium tetraurelia strain d4-2]
MSNFSNKKGFTNYSYLGAKQTRTQIKKQVIAAPAMMKKMKLISKSKGKYQLEVDETFLSQLQQAKQFLAELNDTIHGQVESNQGMVQESNPQFEQQEDDGSSSASDEKSGAQLSQQPQEQQSQQPNEVKETQDFYRRIPHFFMGRFKKWAKILKEDDVSTFLHQLKSNKKSKQGRYELGDFHKQAINSIKRCFQIDKNDNNEQQKQKKKIKELFLEFLQNEAVLQIIQYNKITNQDQKIKYIDVIPNMVQEMYSDKPFDQFLAQQNIEKQINKKKQLLNETQEVKQQQQQQQQLPQLKQDQSFEEPPIKFTREMSFQSQL